MSALTSAGPSFLAGLLLGLSLILAIGAQNAFVLRQGLRGEHVFAVCLVCALSDALLIAVGVTSLATVSAALPWMAPALRWGGAAFLLAYAARSLLAAFGAPERLVPEAGAAARPLRAAVGTALVLTFANPHVYLDTVVLIGTVSTRQDHPAAFGAGAVLASFLFFFALGFGARWLRPIFARARAWQILEIAIAAVMAALGLRLAFGG
ncbi:LysE/ArgO family amino acid transporter [Aureimonas pseudogalii]|uniref:L-lysine exporter family protein LysE/ArgO n=1 Tax=Aureimonas pseudogalii TaxID=1744844 RepID=A0A7W6H757_9HYPH|nr:LysE family transporter [Aureimonas pseudogalii]MBB3999813.1 L-lysine exporter family protein LysE/ArgO [Aureimonas pseudogalii]